MPPSLRWPVARANAAAKVLVDISKTQDSEVGDGTGTGHQFPCRPHHVLCTGRRRRRYSTSSGTFFASPLTT